MQCNDECCESRDGKRKWKTNSLTAKTKEKFRKLNDDLTDEERKQPKHKPDVLDDKVTASQDNTDSITLASEKENAENIVADDLTEEERQQPQHKPNVLDDKVVTSQDNTPQAHNLEDAEKVIADDHNDDERKWPKHKPDVLDDKMATTQDNTTQASNVENEENGVSDDLTAKEMKPPSHKPNALDDKAITSQDNTTQAHNVEDAENIIAALKKQIKSLQIRLKKKNHPEVHNQLDRLLNDPVESNHEDYNSTISNETEISSYDEKDNNRYNQGKNQLTTTPHDLINDDDQEPSNFDEGELHNALENDTRATLNESTYNEENNVSITNNDKEPGAETDAPINEENKINPTQSPTVQITNEIIDDKEKLNENSVINMDDLDEKTAQEPDEDESRSGSNVNEPMSELGLNSLTDSGIDPTEELLNEEAIDDAGRFGRKRNFIRKRKKPH